MVTFGLAAIILFGPKFAYNAVERTVGILVIAVTLGLMAVAVPGANAQTPTASAPPPPPVPTWRLSAINTARSC